MSKLSLIGTSAVLAACLAQGESQLPYTVKDGAVDESTWLGWRTFHSACHGCHGVDATGTSVAPSLVERVANLTARDFSVKVLTRYRITSSTQAAGSGDKTELREGILQEVLRREQGEIVMPAWQGDLNVRPHVLDIYAYLRARADGALGRGRPEKLAAGD